MTSVQSMMSFSDDFQRSDLQVLVMLRMPRVRMELYRTDTIISIITILPNSAA